MQYGWLAMNLEEACGALWLSMSPEARCAVEEHALWNAFALTRASEEDKQLTELNAIDYGRCFFTLAMTLIKGDPEDLVANTKKLVFSHYVLRVNELINQGFPTRESLTTALGSIEDRYLAGNSWFERLLQVLQQVDADSSLDDPGQAAMVLVEEIMNDLML